MAGTTNRWFLQLRESFRRSRKNNESGPRQASSPEDRRPLSLRTTFTAVTLAYTVALIAALEYCFQTLPISHDRRDNIPNGTASEVYGPFNWAPLGRFLNNTESSFAPLPTLTPWNSSAVVTPTLTLTEGVLTTTLPPDPFPDLADGTVFFGSRPGILGFDFPVDTPVSNTTHGNSTTKLSRRVPPPEKWGQLPGRVQYVQFDVVGRIPVHPKDPQPGWVWAYIEYFYDSAKGKAYSSIKNSKQWCPTVCDGPALVFLETYCWDSWRDKASLYKRRTALYPTAIHTNSEDPWMEGTPCPTAVASAPIAVEVPPDAAVPATTLSSRTVDAEIIEVTTISGQPTTLTRTTQLVIPVEPVPVVPLPVDVNPGPGPGPTRTGPAAVPANPTDEGWTPTTTITQKDNQGRPTATVTARLRATETTMTLTNQAGVPTATITTNIPLVRAVVTFSGTDGIMTTSTVLVPLYNVPGQQDSLITLTNSEGVPVATIAVSPNHQHPRLGPRPGTHGSVDANAVGQDLHPVSWRDYLFASFGPILLALPLAWLVQMQSSSLKALLPYHILFSSSSSFSSTIRSRSSSVTSQPQEMTGGGGATAADSLCLITGGPRGIWNGIRLLFVGTRTTGRKEPLGFLADLHVVVLSAIVSLSSEALGIKLIGRCRVDDFRGCHMGVSLFLVPGRILQALLVLSLALGVLNMLILLQRREWKRAVDIYARHGNRGVEGTQELLDGSPQDTKEFFKKVTGSAAEDADTNGDGYISTKEMARHLDGHLFAIRVRAKTMDSVTDLSRSSSSVSASTDEKKRNSQPPAAPTRISTYYLEVTPRENGHTKKDDPTYTWSTDMKAENGPSRSETMDSWLGPLNSLSLTPARQDMLGQMGFILAMAGVLVLILYYELTSNPDSPFERFMNSQGLGVRSLFTAMGVVVSLFWDNHSSDMTSREPYRQLVLASEPSFTSTSAVRWNHLIVLTAMGAALSKVTPILLGNVPFSPWLTWLTHQVCTWSAVGILGFMILVVSYTYIRTCLAERREPQMPIHPGTLVGRLFYVARYKTR
ncbi:hypothetical protein V8F20_002818 [Naviculisporaceae sp. PSN 640]